MQGKQGNLSVVEDGEFFSFSFFFSRLALCARFAFLGLAFGVKGEGRGGEGSVVERG